MMKGDKMERKINALSMLYLVFLTLLLASGAFSGALGYIVYFLAFLIPFIACLVYMRKEEKSSLGHLGFYKNTLRHTLVLTAPTVALIMAVSAITSMLVFAVSGKTNEVDVGSSLLLALLSHALVPAVVEEGLFRYLPMRLLSDHSKRVTVLVSAFFFALIHHSVFSLFYAFLAGIIFMSVDLALDSIWPSVIIHFVNNAVSVLLMFGLGAVVYPCLFGLCALSVLVIILNRSEYKNLFLPLLSGGEKFRITPELAVFGAVNLLIAVVALF